MPGRLRTFFKSFRFKLILGSVLVEVVVLALLVGNSIRLMNHTVEYHAKIMADDFAPLLDGALSLPLFERDHAVLMEVLAKLTKSGKSDLKYIVVFDDQGNVYGKSGEVDAAAIPEVDRSLVNVDHNRVYNARATLLLGGETVGRVRYGISLDRLIEVRSDLLNQGTIIAATGITLTIVLLTLVGVFLTRHIRQLADATRKIAGGDYSTRLHRLSNDEVGELADNFNTMVETVHDRMQRLHDSEQALFQEKERVLVTLHSIGDGVITTDVAGNIQIMNPVAEKLTGWSNAEAEGRPLMEVFNIKNEVTGRALGSPVNKCLESNGVVSLSNNTLLSSRTGMESPIEDSTAPIHNREGGIIGVVLVFHDVSDTRKMVRQMTYQAQHDALTGLANRGEFESRLRLALESAKSESREHAVFYMDLDHFKIVNDTCGHFAGDELLKLLTAELKNKIREADILARLGGDEFGLLLENCPMSRAAQIAENVRVTIKNYRFEWDRKLFEVGVSIGVVAITSASGVMANILSAADVACYIAKESGGNKVHLHSEDSEEASKRHNEMNIVTEITSAFEENRFTLFCQKIIPGPAARNQTPHIELLIRMVKRDGELILPKSFIPAAERFYLMQRIDTWVVQQTLEFMETNSHLLQDEVFSINLSGQSLANDSFLDFLVAEIARGRTHPGRLCFEVTETAAISNLKKASHFIKRIKELGCYFSLDDFGSGLSSFAYLKNLNVDYLKIDGAFVKDMLSNETDAAMVEAINQIGHVMGLKTIAEYVENHAILDAINHLGVDYAQGYGIHRPEPLTDLIRGNARNMTASPKNATSSR